MKCVTIYKLALSALIVNDFQKFLHFKVKTVFHHKYVWYIFYMYLWSVMSHLKEMKKLQAKKIYIFT